jgi:hypothetical protein
MIDVLKKLLRGFEAPAITQRRTQLAYGVAVTTDVLQVILGPVGWGFADEALDVAAMLVISRLIGFHPLLLPTFAVEFIPIVDMLPTWTGCVAVVVALRKREAVNTPPRSGSVIDV